MQRARRDVSRWRWYWLLLLPYLALLWPPLYVRAEPQVAGIPFFYWYQFIWIALSGAITGLVYLLTREHRYP